jgi:hypothetical protein
VAVIGVIGSMWLALSPPAHTLAPVNRSINTIFPKVYTHREWKIFLGKVCYRMNLRAKYRANVLPRENRGHTRRKMLREREECFAMERPSLEFANWLRVER